MSFNGLLCQQCKEPLQLDASLIDLAPSAYDMIVASLPPDKSTHANPALGTEQPARLTSPSSSSAKSVWQHSKINTPSGSLPHAQGKHTQRGLLPNESFVLLQDSIVRTIPPSMVSPTRSRRSSVTSPRATSSLNVERQATEPEHPNPAPLTHHLRSTLRLFNLLSSRTDIDHPLCDECTQIILASLQRQLDETKKERDGYIAFEKEVRRERDRDVQGLSKEEMEKKIDKLGEEERAAVEQLKAAERDKDRLEEEMRALEAEEMALEAEEAEFWRAHNEHLLAADQQAAQLAGLRAAYAADSATLERLERANVYNDAFCIGHDGVFGTINGLRLGRVPGVPVEWAEINAAWGQTILLLYTIARKLDYTFENYRLIPMGTFSRIDKITGDKATYELYGSGDLHLGRLLHNRRFDIAMVAFLDCLKHLIDHVKSQDQTVEFPHQIVKDRIGDVSVKMQFNQEEHWTRALRHVLLALKILLKWTTNGSNG
ncbi:APG6-domain-containing protein [Pleurotus eryngii]|uniref:APG6-domain-containing protein n=1 Tax=Pleurotus eryngii TaxID=5323 RepID=A0A9P6A9U3_PLEER|nr:APG6-domain-containing protein [Pleurotus eryngii]